MAIPSLSSVLPTSLPADNNSHLMDIYGTNFASGDTLTFIDPQGQVASSGAPTIVSSTQLEYTLNDGSDPGTWTVRLDSPSGSFSDVTFSVTAVIPTLSHTLPTSLPADNNSHLMDIYGTNFASGDTLTFIDPQGQVASSGAPTIVSSTQLEYTLNDGNDPGTWTVRINGPSGNVSELAFSVTAAHTMVSAHIDTAEGSSTTRFQSAAADTLLLHADAPMVDQSHSWLIHH